MGARGAIIMSFFGAVFAALTFLHQYGVHGPMLVLPFLIFAAIAGLAWATTRGEGTRFEMSPEGERALAWSTAFEGVGLFLAANIVTNLGHPEYLMPAMALVVGLHFLPIAHYMPFPQFYAVGGALLLAAFLGFAAPPPMGGEIAGFSGALTLWAASLLALRRERKLRVARA